MIEYKIFKKEEILENFDSLMKFYGEQYDSGYDVALKNSSHVCCCIKDGVVVGACRVMTDHCSQTFIVDLIVDEKERKNGIGRRIMQDAIKCVLELDTYFNSISTDPNSPWLKDFYESLGFVQEKNNFVLSYPKK